MEGNNGFQCWFDAYGDIWVTDGVVIQSSTGVQILVGTGRNHVVPRIGREDFLTPFPAAASSAFVGGSGRNLSASGLTPVESGPDLPVGFYRPQEPGFFRSLNGFELEVTGASAATISDGTDVIAELTTGGTAPLGDYVATTYGETTYNGGDPFTITVAAEDVAGGDPPTFFMTPTDGTAPDGDLGVIDAANYELALDTDWTITVDLAGTAQIRYLGDVIAERADGSAWEPLGVYEAVETAWTYNMQADEEEVDQPTAWSMIVQVRGRTPRAGYAYIIVTETSGTLTAVTGPFFGALPTPPTGSSVVILAQCDGLGGIEQYHTGALVWPGGSGGGSGAPFVEITEDDFIALGTPDSGTYYDITDLLP